MTVVWQNVAAVCMVIGAVLYVARRVWRSGTSKSCPACDRCARLNRRP